jgi:hypothetical protein
MRLNEGTLFLAQREIYLCTNNWFHSFQIILPKSPSQDDLFKFINEPNLFISPDNLNYFGIVRKTNTPSRHFVHPLPSNTSLQDCKFPNPSCDLTQNFYEYTNFFHYQNLMLLRETLFNLKSFVPELSTINRKKREESQLNLYEKVMKWTGLATDKDLQILYHNLLQLKSAVEQTSQHLTVNFEKQHSVTTILASQIRQISQVLRAQKDLWQGISAQASQNSLAILHTFQGLAKSIYGRELLQNLKIDLERISENKFPFHIINSSAVLNALEFIKSNLSEMSTPLFLVHKTYSDIIRMNNYVVTRFQNPSKTNFIILTLQLPLSITELPFTLYRIVTLSLPADESNVHSSIIYGLPEYLIFHPTADYYIEITGNLPEIQGNILYLYQNPQILKHVSKKSCAMALILLERDDIKALCTFKIQPFIANRLILLLPDATILLQFVSNYSLEYDNVITYHPGCTLCVIKLKCKQVFRSDEYQYSAPLGECESLGNNSSHTISYAINLILFDNFINTTELLPFHQICSMKSLMSDYPI